VTRAGSVARLRSSAIRVRGGSIAPNVVPANAGTHNHRSLLVQKPLARVARREAAAYGSPRSRGRRVDGAFVRNELLRIQMSNNQVLRGYSFADTASRSRRTSARVFAGTSALGTQRAQGMPGARRARSRAWCVKNTRVSHHGHTGNRPAFPAQWFYDLFRALPGDRACLPPSPLRSLLLKNLTPASGRQDHTTSPSASAPFVFKRIRVHRIPPRGRDDRDSPLCGTGR
jgi:hypothetical protein